MHVKCASIEKFIWEVLVNQVIVYQVDGVLMGQKIRHQSNGSFGRSDD